MEKELTSGVVYGELINPFPSLPTFPDVEMMHAQSHQGLTQHYQQHQQHQQHQRANEDQTSLTKMVSPGHTPHQQWVASQQATNISDFMPQTSISPVELLVTYSNTGQGAAGFANVTAGRVFHPAPMPALHQIYSSPNGKSSMSLNGDPTQKKMEDIFKKIPAISPMAKDGKQVIIGFYLINSNYQVISFIICISIVAWVVLHRFEGISRSRVSLLPGCWNSVW